MSVLISLDSVVGSLRSSIPDAEWLLRRIESEQGYLRFPPCLTNIIINLKLENYPLLYANEDAIAVLLFKTFFTDDEMRELASDLEAASPEERGEFITVFQNSIIEGFEGFEIPKTPIAQEAARQMFLSLPEDEQKEAIRVAQYFIAFFLASFYQHMSVMVHGEKLSSLVAQAVAGNDEAFAKAVQIDKRILTAYPYFSARFDRAQAENDANFYDLISYRLRVPPYRGKIRYKSLWLTLAILEKTGFLDQLNHREILEICDEAGVGGWENRIQDVKYLSKRIQEYRVFQKRGILPTP